MTRRTIIAAVAASFLFAACGGGYGGSAGSYGGNAMAPVPNVAPSSSASAPASTATIKGSPGFVSPSGFTLYVFDADMANVSNCNDGCATVWPPFKAAAGAAPVGSFTIIARTDGSKQWAYKTRPLYNFSGDTKPGDANGDGLNLNGGIWHVARP